MYKILFTFFLFSLLGCSQKPVPEILPQGYNFYAFGDIHKLLQANDTLIDHYFRSDGIKRESLNRIVETKALGNYIILKLKNLGSIPISENLCPGKPFSIVILKNFTQNKIGHSYLQGCLTEGQLDSLQINLTTLDATSFITYYSDSYIKHLSSFKKIASTDDLREIFNSIENNDFDKGRISYSADQLSKACIENGFNPVGANLSIDSLLQTNRK